MGSIARTDAKRIVDIVGPRRSAFREGLPGLGLTYNQLTACLGGACYDVHLNDVVKRLLSRCRRSARLQVNSKAPFGVLLRKDSLFSLILTVL